LTWDTLEAAYERGREALRENPGFIAEQDRLGRERSLIYKTLTLTGLRKGELASITVGQVELDAPQPYAELLARDEKSGRGAKIPLRRDLVTDIREYLAARLEALQQEARDRGEAILLRLPLDAPLFNVPAGFIRVFDRDLEAAGIPKHDERGRTVDIHALRHTFGTHLSKNGVAPRTAQAAMRHSKLELTMNVYTDPELLDVAGAMEALPRLTVGEPIQRETAGRTGT
jgi:integrase